MTFARYQKLTARQYGFAYTCRKSRNRDGRVDYAKPFCRRREKRIRRRAERRLRKAFPIEFLWTLDDDAVESDDNNAVESDDNNYYVDPYETLRTSG